MRTRDSMKHLEVSTAAANGANALVGFVTTVRSGQPERFKMRTKKKMKGM
jgi:hypothetical protein